MPLLLEGTRVRDAIEAELRPRVEQLTRAHRPPGLAVILAGNHPASEIYVRNKVQACQRLGIYSEKLTPPINVTTEELVSTIAQLNAREDIDGILIQLPLPSQVDAKAVLLAVEPDKDADGLHPLNLGRLFTGRAGPRPCTPAGILEMLRRYEIAIHGRRAVVVGRSDLVGKPAAMLLLAQHATVTICHSKTPDLAAVCREADILVAAMGRAAMLTADFIRDGATVIDVGMNRLTSRDEAARVFRGSPEKLAEFDRKGSLLVGDVHPLDVAQKAAAYTPVPGGVGPLTIAALMMNTVAAAERRFGLCST
jgi:methylenetetrahydrofolate dehydrogenase (NADP+)/methenyltetrahydrofolate cyclohydrolase